MCGTTNLSVQMFMHWNHFTLLSMTPFEQFSPYLLWPAYSHLQSYITLKRVKGPPTVKDSSCSTYHKDTIRKSFKKTMLLNKHLMLQYSTNLIQTYIEHTTFSQTYSMNDLLCLFSRNIRLLISETNLKFWNKDTSYIQKNINSLSNNCLFPS